jgi:hypothetical protein
MSEVLCRTTTTGKFFDAATRYISIFERKKDHRGWQQAPFWEIYPGKAMAQPEPLQARHKRQIPQSYARDLTSANMASRWCLSTCYYLTHQVGSGRRHPDFGVLCERVPAVPRRARDDVPPSRCSKTLFEQGKDKVVLGMGPVWCGSWNVCSFNLSNLRVI